MSSKTFKCESCRAASESLHMRNSDGRWVCRHCIPAAELDACEGLRERLGLKPKAARTKPQKNALMEWLEEKPKSGGARRKAA